MALLKSYLSSVDMYWRDVRGNIAVTMALVIVPMLTLAGGAIEVVRMSDCTMKLQGAVDSATLAAASLTNQRDIEETILEYVGANMPDGGGCSDPTVEVQFATTSLNLKTVSVLATVDMETPLLSLVGMSTTTVGTVSTAQESAQDIEISMVLDISSSMNGSKLTNLKDAAGDFVEEMLRDDRDEYTSINLIPFGGTVNVDEDLYNRYVATGPADVNPDPADYTIGNAVTSGRFVFPSHPIGCLEHPNADFDLDDIPLNSRAQVPRFWKWNQNNPWCPPIETTAAIFNSNNETELKDRINEMALSDGTGMDIGAMWGAKALSPALRGVFAEGDFPDRPADFDDPQTVKYAIFMTDGEITRQFRPEDWTLESVHTEEKNNENQQTVTSTGNFGNSSSSANNSIAYFKRMCEDLKEQNVQIFTIGFQINEGSTADKLLEYCASQSTMYYFVENLDIETAFESIAASINALRITG